MTSYILKLSPPGKVDETGNLKTSEASEPTLGPSSLGSISATYATPGSYEYKTSAAQTGVYVLAVAGGGGGSGGRGGSTGGSGGGSGAAVIQWFPVTPSTSYTVVVGAGGAGGDSFGDGKVGGNSSFGLAVAGGGLGATVSGGSPGALTDANGCVGDSGVTVEPLSTEGAAGGGAPSFLYTDRGYGGTGGSNDGAGEAGANGIVVIYGGFDGL